MEGEGTHQGILISVEEYCSSRFGSSLALGSQTHMPMGAREMKAGKQMGYEEKVMVGTSFASRPGGDRERWG